MGKKTPLYDCHLQSNAKMVDFAGWDMPLHYGSQVQEHHIVRKQAGVFDVSHMTIVECIGSDAFQFLRQLVANDVNRLTPGKALYTCMLNEQGGVLDDLIIYKIDSTFYRLVVNSATRDKDLAWIKKQANAFNITITERTDLAMLAIQGPAITEKLSHLFDSQDTQAILSLKPFHFLLVKEYFIARTGYTGEDGFEIILPAIEAPSFWNKLLKAEIHPCGLGARDTLRLEAGLNLYGADMDETTTPLESNLGWTIAWEPKDRDFIGRSALEQQREKGAKQRLVGIILEGPGVLRNHQKIMANGIEVGEITSGSFSPTLNKGIALARVNADIGPVCLIDIRGKQVTAQVTKPPFVKKNIVVTVGV
ncbi:MAG: glycine cleavage system aminomethyltransferase GcvT [Gammaproteobacteria bacterium]|nr:glycine cleavage system aminomethyltransferase GcvT [Gammaproteobacteria bacterium]